MKVVWIASYPKSGNTWVRFLLYAYLNGSAASSSEIQAAIPDIHVLLADNKRLNTELAHTIICKTHFVFSDKHAHKSDTAGFIYVLRHLKDVLLSNLHYFKLTSKDEFDDKAFVKDFIDNMGLTHWQNSGFGLWNQHVAS